MFNNCSNVQIVGGSFTNIHLDSQPKSSITHSGLTARAGFAQNFHSVRLGDLNLLSEIGNQETVKYREVRRRKTGALVRLERVVASKRRIYQACVSGRPGAVTAVVYQGPDVEKWMSEAEKHETFRHPSLVQLYGVSVSRAMNVLIYIDALVPLRDIRELHAGSALASTYVEYGIVRDLAVYPFFCG
ncbi:hypothetical protein B0H12DRAFT_380448 [Mycena haematopus]|nr:hypothetical protein B0H12DRAFT_380448 [Mycena haematopus]